MKDSVYFPDPSQSRPEYTTDLCIAAHPDDMELMAYPAISDCYDRQDRFFTGMVLTNGAGCGKGDLLEGLIGEEIAEIRKKEQYEAADIGKYLAVCVLPYYSEQLRRLEPEIVEKISDWIKICKPDRVYIHNFADKHETHVAAALAAWQALKGLSEEERPNRVYSMEVWRSLDWLRDENKTVFGLSGDTALERGLIQVFKSQIAGNKRYDTGVIGRRRANAVFLSGYQKDSCDGACYALDVTDWVFSGKSPLEMLEMHLNSFKADVMELMQNILNRSDLL